MERKHDRLKQKQNACLMYLVDAQTGGGRPVVHNCEVDKQSADTQAQLLWVRMRVHNVGIDVFG
jgi:hypothetical protein